ncbi:hypothetical protein ATANTOWER_021623 [Ataeniobius toweri]|uniref:Uncharacterized protein n=1 Tax=Ataeniobius toweri TaxID=208326 RepID=A0ABU7AM05_9TELE|nr:hypothetical protein [Ataeniobius toweri]
MLWRVLEKTTCCSNHEPPFLSHLQPCSSEITSRKHQTIAHPPVHPPTPHAQLKHCCLRITKGEHQHCESVCYTPTKLSLCGADLPPPISHHPPPTCQSRSIRQLQSVS